MQLVSHRSSLANHLVTMSQELSHIPLRWGGNPDPREPVRQQQVEDMQRIPRIRLLLAYHRCPNLRRIAHP